MVPDLGAKRSDYQLVLPCGSRRQAGSLSYIRPRDVVTVGWPHQWPPLQTYCSVRGHAERNWVTWCVLSFLLSRHRFPPPIVLVVVLDCFREGRSGKIQKRSDTLL